MTVLRILSLICIFSFYSPTGAQAKYSNWDREPYSPIELSIEMEKTDFAIKEPLEGIITLDNPYPGNLPAVFYIQLFHDGRQITERVTSIKKIPTGTTEFSFKSFGVPRFNLHPSDAGTWILRIFPQNDEDRAAEVTLHISRREFPKKESKGKYFPSR